MANHITKQEIDGYLEEIIKTLNNVERLELIFSEYVSIFKEIVSVKKVNFDKDKFAETVAVLKADFIALQKQNKKIKLTQIKIFDQDCRISQAAMLSYIFYEMTEGANANLFEIKGVNLEQYTNGGKNDTIKLRILTHLKYFIVFFATLYAFIGLEIDYDYEDLEELDKMILSSLGNKIQTTLIIKLLIGRR